jgi:FMN phosphatase YigB (HAD superfamily)
MIKAILIDLDGTLIRTPDLPVFTRSMQLLSSRVGDIAVSKVFLAEALAAMQASRANLDPTATVGEVFYHKFHERLGCAPNSLVPIFQHFYQNGLGDLRAAVTPKPLAPELMRWLSDSSYKVVVAADPAMDSEVIRQHLRWGGLAPEAYPFHMFGALDTMHFSKPHPRYFEEILARIDVQPEEALMVGDNWQADIQPAARAGLNTFWVTTGTPSANNALIDGQGALEDFLRAARDEQWLDSLKPRVPDWQAYKANLLSTLAAIDSFVRETDPDLWTFKSDDDTWSMRDSLCHLRDHEIELDQPRLQQVLEEENPFISATNYDPHAHAHEYETQNAREALHDFAALRAETITTLDALPPTAWERPARHSIFGPTTLGEIVKFMADHDRIHLRQMRDAVTAARQQITRSSHPSTTR